jgi:hypothetical protein
MEPILDGWGQGIYVCTNRREVLLISRGDANGKREKQEIFASFSLETVKKGEPAPEIPWILDPAKYCPPLN